MKNKFLIIISSMIIALMIVTTLEAQLKRKLSTSERQTKKAELRGKIFREHIPLKDDYVDEKNRGTVEYSEEKGINMFGQEVHKRANYAYHKTEIPDGSTIRGVNFSQEVPETEAITGKNLTFIDCNLVNVKVDPSWTLIRTNNAQIQKSIVTVNGTQYEVKKVKRGDKYVEISNEIYTP